MRRFIAARALQALIVVIVVATLVFALAHIAPGDPFLSDETPLSTADRDRLRAQWGYDQPLWRQYAQWGGNFVRGDFGWSHSRNRPVAEVLGDAIPNTLILMIPAVLLGLLAGVAFGTWQAARRGRPAVRAADAATLTLISIPDFIVALAVLSVFAIHWRIAPMSGMVDVVRHDSMAFGARMRDVLAHMVLPGGTLALVIAASVSRYHRAAVIGVLHEDYVRTARAKGAAEGRVVVRHALRNALGPVIVIAGLLLPVMFGGAVFVEKIFAWPGMGTALVDAIGARDYALVQAVALLSTVLVVFGSLVADVLAVLANPRLVLDA